MEGARRKHAVFYRCAARTLIPGSSAALGHPPTVYVREDQLSHGLNGWIAGLFSPDNLDETVAVLVGADDLDDPTESTERVFRERIAAAEASMNRSSGRWRLVGIPRRLRANTTQPWPRRRRRWQDLMRWSLPSV
jgi:hypothetical protein